MALTKYKFGDLIELHNVKNTDGIYGESDAIGVNVDKIIMPMRGSNESKDYEKFHLVPPKHFAYNPRGSRKLGLGFNDTDKTYIITFNDNVFRIKESAKHLVVDTYLFMYLSRKEWDRRAEFISWGSSTEVFDWNIFCEEEIVLPDLPTQQKYVDIYKAMIANQQSCECGLEDLKLVCDGYIEDLRRRVPCEKIGAYLVESDQRNTTGLPVESVRGISTSKELIPTKANMDGVSLDNYKVVSPGQIAYVADTSRRGDKISLGFNDTQEQFLVSSISTVFGTKKEKLLPEYLMAFFTRAEFDRYARFNSWGSARETFDWDEMYNVEIPIPDISVQKAIAEMYTVYIARTRINEQLKAQIKDICPMLIRGSLEEGELS